jgi:hypothetical protein
MARLSDSGKAVAWRRRIRRFARSALTVARFCEEEGVSTVSFYRWRKRLAKQPTSRTTKPPQPNIGQTPAFQAVRVTTSAIASMSIHLPGGTRVDVPMENLDAIRAVLAELVRQDATPDRGASPC